MNRLIWESWHTIGTQRWGEPLHFLLDFELKLEGRIASVFGAGQLARRSERGYQDPGQPTFVEARLSEEPRRVPRRDEAAVRSSQDMLRMGFEIEPQETEVDGVAVYHNYDGCGSDRVLFVKNGLLRRTSVMKQSSR